MNRPNLAAAIWAGRNSEQRRFLNVGGAPYGWSHWLLSRRTFLSPRRKISPRYFQSLDTDSCQPFAIDHQREAHFRTILCQRNSNYAFVHFLVAALVSLSTTDVLQPEKRETFVDG